MENTAKPIQARSQKTKEKLLTAAIAMYAKNGYHGTTVDEIAAEAGVSTGIAYRYFRNKKDLLLSALEFASKEVQGIASLDSIDTLDDHTDFRKYIDTVLSGFEDIHDRFHDIHEELEGLQHTDEDVRKFYVKVSRDMMENVIDKLSHFSPDQTNIREKAYLAVSLLEQFCHLRMNSDQIDLDFDVLRKKTIETVMMILN
jgi:AcrR family transcriptional regulator